MPAGAVGVPQIIPLRPPKGCRRHVIDSATEIELVSGEDPTAQTHDNSTLCSIHLLSSLQKARTV